MAVETTVFSVVSTGQEFGPIPGDWSPEAIVSTYSSNIPGLASMQSVVTVEGTQKSIVFSPRTGTKG